VQFSGTFSPAGSALAGIRRQAAQDPIAEARQLLHAAARVPFAAARPLQWSTSFAQHVGAARDALHRHISKSVRPDSPMSEIERDEPRLKPAIDRQRAEHRVLSRQADELFAEASIANDVDIWRMIDLGERAILLEMALARHHNRLVRLVYETTHRELGGEAG